MAAPAVGISESPRNAAERLCSELQFSWSLVGGLLRQLSEVSSSVRDSRVSAGSLRLCREQYEAETRALLVEPVEQFLSLRPIRRSLEAMQKCDQELGSTSRGRTRVDARFQRTLAKAAADLCEPWRIYRRRAEKDEWHKWNERSAAHAQESSALLEQYARWARGTSEDAGGTENRTEDKKKVSRYEMWFRQERAAVALAEMEISLRKLDLVWFDSTEDFVSKVRDERDRVLSCARQTLDWIQSGAEAGSTAPEQMLELVSPDERFFTWTHWMEGESAKCLPERAELVIPGRYPRWRSVAARDSFLSAFATYAQPSMRQTLEHYWSQAAESVREVARAREIIEYWRETSHGNSRDGQTLFADARHNAAAMLSEQIETPLAVEELEGNLRDAFRTWSQEGSVAIEAKQFGWIGLLPRPSGRGFLLRAATRSGRQRLQSAAHRTGRWASNRVDRTLESIGGKVPTRPMLQPVVRRTTLRDTLSLPDSKISNLPAIYRLLFRPTPVEDRRFLIGRNQELAGLEQAVKDWEAGRFAACLVVGARGSGKTSLLNCAAREVLASHTLVRGQFRDRALSPDKIDAFLRQLLGLSEDADLEAAFAAERRILAIEESERIYLRKVGGFGGADYLIRLIHRTASTTLWIIGMNERALRVLDAGAHFGRVFSHRINSTSVSREDLEKAILERHRLSGLRLEFAPPPAEDPRVSHVKKWLGLQDSPQKLFFDSLFQQSEGILRSAFELWLSSIDRAEGETLKIRQPLDPAFSKFRSELAQEDHFTLLAIQEHGSVTQGELAEVLCEGHDASRSRLDRLMALGLIEPDPDYPGLRVRPEAQRFTNDLLRRINLT